MRSLLSALSYLAIWPALYAAAAVVCLGSVAGLAVDSFRESIGIAMVVCTALATYLLDRVKLKDSWLDPADAAAHPRRYFFLAARTRVIRALIGCALCAAMVCAALLARWTMALPVLSCAGVLVYAAKPRRARPRPKDLLLLKNAYVASGIVAFSLLTLLAIHEPGPLGTINFAALVTPSLLFSSAHLFLRIFADAALCDLDDEDSDRRHGTTTLPTHFGRLPAWNLAMMLRLGLALALAVVPIGPLRPRLAWAAVTVVSTLSLRLSSPAHIRDAVDLRFAIEAVVVSLVLAWG